MKSHNPAPSQNPVNLSLWASNLKAHLQEFSPRFSKELEQEGKLDQYVQKRADQAGEIVADHVSSGGLPMNQALEFVKDILYPPPESPTP